MYITAHEATLNGVSLSDVDPDIIVLGCGTEAGKDTMSTATLSGRSGQTVTGRTRDYIDATVRFGIRCKRSRMNERGVIYEKAMAWAAAARDSYRWLTFGHKPGRRLLVRLNTLPAEGDPWDWNAEYTISFRANEVPYWQDVSAVTETVTGSATLEQAISVSGNVKTVLELTYVNGSSSVCNTLDISTGSAEMHFTGLGVAAGESLVIDHSAGGVLRIRVKDTSDVYRSVFAKRVALTSADDLWIQPGARTVTGTAQRSGTWTISCRGRYE